MRTRRTLHVYHVANDGMPLPILLGSIPRLQPNIHVAYTMWLEARRRPRQLNPKDRGSLPRLPGRCLWKWSAGDIRVISQMVVVRAIPGVLLYLCSEFAVGLRRVSDSEASIVLSHIINVLCRVMPDTDESLSL